MAVGLVLVTANLAVTLLRTGIPRSLDGEVTTKRILYEKHPGNDDVLRLEIDAGRPFQVERGLFSRVTVGAKVGKSAWSRSITVDDAQKTIPWSVDFVGMLRIAPLLGAGLVILGYRAMRSV